MTSRQLPADAQTATYINDGDWESGSGAAGIALDVILTPGISSAIDSATGADNKYESPVNITLLLGVPPLSGGGASLPAAGQSTTCVAAGKIGRDILLSFE